MIKFGEANSVNCHCGGTIEIIAPPEVSYKKRPLIPATSGITRKELKFRFPAECTSFSHALWFDVVEFDEELYVEISSREEIVLPVHGKDWPKALEAEAMKSAMEWEK